MVSTSAGRRLRGAGGTLIRRWGLLPAGEPDGLGDDEQLRGKSLPWSVLVFFPETLRNVYQLRQWYGPLRRLAARHPVGIVCQDSRTATAVRAESGLPVMCIGRIGTLEDLVSRSDIALAFYVSHNPRNLHPLRFPTMLHVYLGHGESDKAASASNQVKAYDVVLVPGDAGRERLRRNLLRYDVDSHVRTVGRPQLDQLPPAKSRTDESSVPRPRPTVLYAPTWEGAQPSMAYSSVVSHGEPLMRSLLDAGEFRVIYRPHPRTGANRPEYASADQHLRSMVRQAGKADPPGRHAVDLTPAWEVWNAAADLLVSDVSAVASDWMTTGKPLIVTVPVAPEAFLDGDTVLAAAPGLPADRAAEAARLVRAELAGDDVARRRRWVAYTMGDVTPGAPTARFLAACDELVELRRRELAERARRLAAGRS